jgi:hypothetical protein
MPSASSKDVDARRTKKHGKSFFGYKNHVWLVRTIGLARAAVKIARMNLTYNFKRYLVLIRPGTGAPTVA